MSILKLLIATLFISSSMCAAEPLHKAVKKEVNIPGFDLELIKKGELSVTPSSVATLFGQPAVSGYSLFGYSSPALTLIPYSQELAYSQGDLCHFAYYSDVTVVTVLSGPEYGYQVILSPYGHVLSTQSFYYLDSNAYGLYLRHEYLDVTIVTGTDQVVYFK